ncbi:MAG: DinB family protein [Verrucomicrobiaceae bacterium]|nr:DinB family protein [Verrucomicrobiaceae bacterium]
MRNNTKTVLEAPGAGLPLIELWIGRSIFQLKRRLGSRHSFCAQFEAERKQIRQSLAACPEDKKGEQVLIPRLRGLEDSSRFWSVWMTLEHLRITNTVFASVIKGLTKEQVPTKQASTADVKPTESVGAEVEAAFEASCDHYLAMIDSIPHLKTSARYAHPWFGPLDGEGWHALAAMHMGIHRRQLALIIERLQASSRI